MEGTDSDANKSNFGFNNKPGPSSSIIRPDGKTPTEPASSSGSSGKKVYRRTGVTFYGGEPGSVLVRGYRPRPPCRRIEELYLPDDLEKALKDFAQELSDFQGAVAPNFLRGSDLIVISQDNGGTYGRHARFLSYVPPLLRILHEVCSNMAAHEFNTCSPEAIVVVNSANAGRDFEALMTSLLDNSGHITVKIRFLLKDVDMESYSKRPEQMTKKILPPGINVLIITLEYFMDMLNTAVGSRLFERLRFLVFEETESYVRRLKDSLIRIIKDVQDIVEKRESNLLQMTFSGSKWYHELEDIYRCLAKAQHTVLVIGALNQAIRFAKLDWNVHHMQETEDDSELFESKIGKLLELLKKEVVKVHRVVVCCSSDEVSDRVYESVMKSFCYPTELVNSCRSHNSLTDIISRWSRKQLDVIVLSDRMLKRFDVTDADSLIQFDSPSPVMPRSLSADRFRCLWNRMRDIEADPSQNPELGYLTTHFLMTGMEDNFYPMYRFSKSLETKVTIPAELVLHAKMIEEKDAMNALCSGIQQFGFCNQPDALLCSNRHEFTGMDFETEPLVPHEGEIEVKIMKCENPSFYKVQLLRHFVIRNGSRICDYSYVNELRRRDAELNEYFTPKPPASATGVVDDPKHTPKLLVRCREFKESRENFWCAVVHPEDESYSRAQFVSNIESDPETKKVVRIRVYCVDKGVFLNPLARSVYYLPRKFQTWPPLVVNLVLCNLKPTRGEREYRKKDLRYAETLTNGKTYLGKIWLSVGPTVWVNPLVEFSEDIGNRTSKKGKSVRFDYMEQQVADFNKEHLNVLFDLASRHDSRYEGRTIERSCTSSSFRDDEVRAKQEFHQAGDEIKWAFVEKSSETSVCPVKILTIFGYNPWIFYGVQDNFYDVLVRLEKDLSECIQDYIHGTVDEKRYKEIFCDDYFEPGMIVAARDVASEDGRSWVRAQIISITLREDENRKIFNLFNVDYGDVHEAELEDLFPIPKKFVRRMPFQAIAFKLDTVEPTGVEDVKRWSSEANESFLDRILPEAGGIQLELLAFEDVGEGVNQLEGAIIPCRYYRAVVFVDKVDLGSLLVEEGHALWKSGQDESVSMWRQKIEQFYNPAVDEALDQENENVDVSDNRRNHDIGIRVEDIEASIEEGFDSWLDFFGFPRRNGFALPKLTATNEEEEEIFYDAQDGPLASAPEVEKVGQSMQSLPSTLNRTTATAILLRPTVLWRQTKSKVILTVDLPDIKEFKIDIQSDRRTVLFQTVDKPKNYGFSLTLFGKVLPDYETNLTGMALKISLKKKMDRHIWIRVLRDKYEKYSWLKCDLENIGVDDDESLLEDHPDEYLPESESPLPSGLNEGAVRGGWDLVTGGSQIDLSKWDEEAEPDEVLEEGDDDEGENAFDELF